MWTDDHDGKDELVAADIRFNTTDKNFTYHPASSSCSYDWDVQGVMTHEMGHWLGFAHVETYDSRYQTMHDELLSCRNLYRTLGKGDVYVARQVY